MSLFKCRDLIEINKNDDEDVSQVSFRLKKASDEIINLVELQSRGRKVKIVANYMSDSLMSARYLNDMYRFQQVLLNILSNAVVYSPSGSTVEITFSSVNLNEQSLNQSQSFKTLLSVVV